MNMYQEVLDPQQCGYSIGTSRMYIPPTGYVQPGNLAFVIQEKKGKDVSYEQLWSV